MSKTVLLGRDQKIIEIPETACKQHLEHVPQHIQPRLSFMTEVHHQIRYFVVKQMAKIQKPIAPEFISDELKIGLEHVKSILEELERNLFFLVKNEHGEVVWAYPITVETTPHKIKFKSGERLFGAWAEDVIATPFVQGQLRKEYVSIEVETACKHSNQSMHITIDSDMRFSVKETGANPMVFMPEIDWHNFAERTIIDAYWRNTVFFWSEEFAREYRASTKQVDGAYLTLEQCAYLIPIAQGALFAFR